MKMKKWILRGILAVLAVCMVVWIAWENKALMVQEYTIAAEGVPQSFSGFRIAQISDLHNDLFGENNETLIAMLADTQPDIIVITGDLVDSRRTNIEIGLDFARAAARIAPTYYVTGNHEGRIAEYDTLEAGLTEAGVTVLNNRAVTLERGGEKVTLMGVMDPKFLMESEEDEEDLCIHRALQSIPRLEETYTVLLSHRPELFDVYVENGLDLVLSGHMHGGQFRLPYVGAVFTPGQGLFPKYDAGVFTSGSTSMVVSRGIGNSLIPFRINNPPEIVVVNLQAA